MLDPKNQLTQLFYHDSNGHQSQHTIVNEFKQFYILCSRAAVCLNSSQMCKNMRAKLSGPEIAPLPPCRLKNCVRPITFAKIDSSCHRQRKWKRYGVLFTCRSTRVVFLELINFVKNEFAIMAITRLVKRRGCLKEICCDNELSWYWKRIQHCLETLLKMNYQRRSLSDEVHSDLLHMNATWARIVWSLKIAMPFWKVERQSKKLSGREYSQESMFGTYLSRNILDTNSFSNW